MIFDNSYVKLPEDFHAVVKPDAVQTTSATRYHSSFLFLSVITLLPPRNAAVRDSGEIRHVSLKRSEVVNLEIAKTTVSGCSRDYGHECH